MLNAQPAEAIRPLRRRGRWSPARGRWPQGSPAVARSADGPHSRTRVSGLAPDPRTGASGRRSANTHPVGASVPDSRPLWLRFWIQRRRGGCFRAGFRESPPARATCCRSGALAPIPSAGRAHVAAGLHRLAAVRTSPHSARLNRARDNLLGRSDHQHMGQGNHEQRRSVNPPKQKGTPLMSGDGGRYQSKQHGQDQEVHEQLPRNCGSPPMAPDSESAAVWGGSIRGGRAGATMCPGEGTRVFPGAPRNRHWRRRNRHSVSGRHHEIVILRRLRAKPCATVTVRQRSCPALLG